MTQLQTPWAKDVSPENALPEYPRPNLVRDSYVNLNGLWDYGITQSETPQYEGQILVPYSPETLLSGVQKVVRPEDYLHYRRTFTLPEGFCQGRVILHFGAVDQECAVFLNGHSLGEHKGGYNAFFFDITEALVPGENELTLRVQDATEYKPHARGKQRLVKLKGKISYLFYTPQSGIWKTVWLESVPVDYVEKLQITPLFDDQAIRLHIAARGAQHTAWVQVLDGSRVVAEARLPVNEDALLPLGECRPWCPDSPHLYDLKVVYGEDTVTSYFGMRKLHVARDSKGLLRFFLNNEPVFFNGVLDQGYWPESLLTAPTDEALQYDIRKLKELGFNTIRKHIKVEPERFYYHCDRLGMFVWQDMPNGGGNYNMNFVTILPNVGSRLARGIKDHHYSWFKREDAQGRTQYYEDLQIMVQQLYNHPSIAVWVPFNEGWGQFDARKATALIRSLDDTRFVNEACGWFDQGGGDFYSIHNYSKGLKITPQPDRVVGLTEFGGYAYPVPGHLACKKEFGYQSYKTRDELTANYARLWEEEVYPNVLRGMSTTIYTQTSDIEEEINGIFTYDREVVKFIEADMKALNEKLYRVFREAVRE